MFRLAYAQKQNSQKSQVKGMMHEYIKILKPGINVPVNNSSERQWSLGKK